MYTDISKHEFSINYSPECEQSNATNIASEGFVRKYSQMSHESVKSSIGKAEEYEYFCIYEFGLLENTSWFKFYS